MKNQVFSPLNLIISQTELFHMILRVVTKIAVCTLLTIPAFSQITCPPNIDFEDGNYGYWKFYTGSCCPINTPTLSGAVNNRHVLTSGTGIDPFGGFPIVAPGGGNYSIKLGNTATGAQAERVRYYVHVPTGVNNYSLAYRYAVVFQDPSHTPSQQPRFEVKAFDSSTNIQIPCASFSYVASSSLPGFSLSTVGYQIWYKPWTTATLNLSGYAGKTVIVEFSTGDCLQGAHFGYGYLDLSCSLFEVVSVNCQGAPTTTLSAPPGFQTYTWWNANFTAQVGTGQSVSISTPSTSTQYHVILTPFSGYGCLDTLTTNVNVASLSLNGSADTVVCTGSSIQLNAGATTNSSTINYNWAPSTGLSCTNCAAPVAAPTQTTSYVVTVNDGNGCSNVDTVNVTVSEISTSMLAQPASCVGVANGSATVSASGGSIPYNYTWNTTPVQTTATATGLGAGIYTVVVTDANGCSATDSVTITEPNPLNVSISGSTGATCYGGTSGMATAIATGGTGTYSYSWNSAPVQSSPTVIGLSAGTYTVTVTDANSCSDTAAVTISQPPALSVTAYVSNPLCLGGNSGSATAMPTGGTPPYSYSWNSSPAQQTAAASNLGAGTYTLTLTDANGCTATTSAIITGPATPLTGTINAVSHVQCNGGSNGSATVSATGGAAPYTYLWNTTPIQATSTAANLLAGTYTATITDNNGCMTTATSVITEPAALSVTITGNTLLACYGTTNGSVTASATGGTAPYTYSWNTTPVQTSPTVTGLSAGTYIVSVSDANGCSATQSVTLTEPTALAAAISGSTSVSCYGTSDATATAMATGGTGTYSYLWNTAPAQTMATASNLGAGTYTVTITDGNGCADTAMIIIGQPPALTVSTGVANLNCMGSNNGTATAIVAGGTTPYTYTWNTTPAQTTATASGLSIGAYTVSVTDGNGCTGSANATILPPSTPVNVTVTGSNPVMCAGTSTGIATATGSAGTPPYSYFWNTAPVQNTATATGLAAGTYMVTISDANGCGDTASVTITEPTTALSLSVANATNISCFGELNGSATISASGGTAPYSYSWNTTPVQTTSTASGLGAGTYTLMVTDANGCNANHSITLTEPAQVSASISSSAAVICSGGSTGAASAIATGGTGTYTYSWNTIPVQSSAAATNLLAGNYIVTVVDVNGCSDTASVIVSQPAAIMVTTGVANLNCLGSNSGTATAIVSGGTSPYSYTWNTTPAQATVTAIGLSTGSYSIVVTDANGCTDTGHAVILPPSTPVNVSVAASTPVTCAGGASGTATALGSAGTPPYNYFWNTVPAQTTATAINLATGTYMVTVSDANGCGDTASVTISGLTSPLALGLSNITNVSCFGGTDGVATVTPSGGTAPYSYSWNTTPVQTSATGSGLGAGTNSITVTDANGCSAVQTVVITEPPSMNLALTSSVVTCNGGTDGSATALVTGGVTPYIYNWPSVPAQTTPSVAGIPAGTYQLNVTDANGCTATATTQVNEPTPLTSTMSVANLFCSGGNSGSATVTPAGGVAPYSYSWNTTPVQTTALASNLGLGSYTVTITDANGCTTTNFANIAPPSTPLTASIANVIPVQCFGVASGSATAAPSGGTAPYTYVWNTVPAQSTATAVNLGAGSYTATITDNNGCTANASVNIVQPANGVSASIGNVSPVSCFNAGDGAATVSASGGAAPYTYTWNTIPVQTSAIGSNFAAGTWIATVADANGCTDTQSVTISEPAPLAASLSNMNNVPCFGGSNGTATAVASGGTTPYSWSWNSTPVQTTASAGNLPAGAYVLTVTDNNNCQDTVHATINEPSPITALVNMQNALCQGSTGAATALPAGGTPPYSYNWSTTPVQTSATVSNLSAGSYFLSVTDANGCTYYDTVTVVPPAAAVVANAVMQSDVSCFGGNNGSALATTTGGTAPYNYAWNTVPPQSTAAATGLSAGTYTVTITDDNGCFDTATVVITEPSQINVLTTDIRGTCPGVTNGMASAFASGGTSPYTYLWNTTPAQTTDTVSALLPGTYTVSVTDGSGCTSSGTVIISSFPAPLVDAGPDKTLCEGESTTLSATGAQQYTWSGTAAISCTTCSTPSTTPLVDAVYTVYGTDVNGCSDSDRLFVSVLHRSPVAVGNDTKICEGDTVSLLASGGVEYNWFPGTGLSNNRSSNPVASPATTTTYQVVVTQNICFRDTLEQVVEVLPRPTVDLGPYHKGIAGSVYQINSITTGATSIQWTPEAGLNCDDCFNPVVTLSDNINYTATVSNEMGCSTSDDIRIFVSCDNSAIFVANTFTPNGDGNNDFFYPQGSGVQVINVFQIYNRWGELIYDMKNIQANESAAGWDGRYKGSHVSPDVFVYSIKATCLNGEDIILKGDVSVVR